MPDRIEVTIFAGLRPAVSKTLQFLYGSNACVLKIQEGIYQRNAIFESIEGSLVLAHCLINYHPR